MNRHTPPRNVYANERDVLSAESIDLLGMGGPGVLPWRGLGNPAWGAGNPQSFPSFPKRFVENALGNVCEGRSGIATEKCWEMRGTE